MVKRVEGRDRKIIFQRSTSSTVDAAGAPVITWSNLATTWARVVPMSGTEALRIERQMSTEVARFFCLYLQEITVKDRINYADKNWDIINIRELGRREGLEILAEVVA